MRNRYVLAALLTALSLPARPQTGAIKMTLTPCLWQRDPTNDLPNGGRDYCAPVAVSDGLTYLAQAFGFSGLVSAADHNGQVETVRTLADAMGTDPVEGTTSDHLLRGLQTYLTGRGFGFQRVEYEGWKVFHRDIASYKLDGRPQLAWMRAAAQDTTVVELMNVGWYRREGDTYGRHHGHYIVVVGTGAGPTDFLVHNPALQGARQAQDTRVTLTELGREYGLTRRQGANTNLEGFYRIDGPGLPRSAKTDLAVLDSAIVFSVRKP